MFAGLRAIGSEIARFCKGAFGRVAPPEREDEAMYKFYCATLGADRRIAATAGQEGYAQQAEGDMRALLIQQLGKLMPATKGPLTEAQDNGRKYNVFNQLTDKMSKYEDETGHQFPATTFQALKTLIERERVGPSIYVKEGCERPRQEVTGLSGAVCRM